MYEAWYQEVAELSARANALLTVSEICAWASLALSVEEAKGEYDWLKEKKEKKHELGMDTHILCE